MDVVITGSFILGVALAALCGYLVGSINPAILISRIGYGQDVRQLGSGNAGMTNMMRSFGKKSGIITLVADILKGVVTVVLGRLIVMWLDPAGEALFGASLYGAYAAAVFTILGHMFPVYFRFKGGKGVATSCGVILALQPVVALVLVAIFLCIFFISKMVSLSSIIGMSFYPVVTFLWCRFGPGQAMSLGTALFCTVCSAIITGLVVWMHRENIQRIKNGTEYRFGQKKNQQQNAPQDEAPPGESTNG